MDAKWAQAHTSPGRNTPQSSVALQRANPPASPALAFRHERRRVRVGEDEHAGEPGAAGAARPQTQSGILLSFVPPGQIGTAAWAGPANGHSARSQVFRRNSIVGVERSRFRLSCRRARRKVALSVSALSVGIAHPQEIDPQAWFEKSIFFSSNNKVPPP